MKGMGEIEKNKKTKNNKDKEKWEEWANFFKKLGKSDNNGDRGKKQHI